MPRERTLDEQILVAEGAVEQAYRTYLTIRPITRMSDENPFLLLQMVIGHMEQAANDLKQIILNKHAEAVERERQRTKGGE